MLGGGMLGIRIPLKVILAQVDTYRGKAGDVINAHAVMCVQHSDLASGADSQPVGNVLCCVEGEGVQQQQGQGEVIHKIALLG